MFTRFYRKVDSMLGGFLSRADEAFAILREWRDTMSDQVKQLDSDLDSLEQAGAHVDAVIASLKQKASQPGAPDLSAELARLEKVSAALNAESDTTSSSSGDTTTSPAAPAQS